MFTKFKLPQSSKLGRIWSATVPPCYEHGNTSVATWISVSGACIGANDVLMDGIAGNDWHRRAEDSATGMFLRGMPFGISMGGLILRDRIFFAADSKGFRKRCGEGLIRRILR